MHRFLAAIGLRFADGAMEDAFRRDYAASLIPIQRAGLTLGLFVMTLFIIRDIQLTSVMGPNPLMFRLFVIIPFFAGSLALTFTPWATRHHQAFFLAVAMTLIVLTYVLFAMATSSGIADPRFGFRTMSTMLLMVGVVVLSGLRFEYAVLCAVAVIAGWNFNAQTTGLDATLWQPALIQLIAMLLLTAGASFWMERTQRQQFAARHALDQERAHTERLLSYSMPRHALERLRRGEAQIADAFLEAVVLFVDLAGFTDISKRVGPRQTVRVLDRIFTQFDAIVGKAGLERVKTIGDGYLAIGGMGERRQNDLGHAAEAALAMIAEVERAALEYGLPLALRVGLHVGPVIGGVIGRERPTYDYWGDTLNIASRLETTGETGRVHCSDAVYWRLRSAWAFEARGPIELKGYATMATYNLGAPSAISAVAAGRDET